MSKEKINLTIIIVDEQGQFMPYKEETENEFSSKWQHLVKIFKTILTEAEDLNFELYASKKNKIDCQAEQQAYILCLSLIHI